MRCGWGCESPSVSRSTEGIIQKEGGRRHCEAQFACLPRSDQASTDEEVRQWAADDLAVMISVNADVEGAVAASRENTGRFRAYVHIKSQERRKFLRTPGEALDVAQLTIESAREARHRFGIRGKVHLFMAVPAGLAMLIGQLSNTLGPVQTYEHIQTDATGMYEPAALLGRFEGS